MWSAVSSVLDWLETVGVRDVGEKTAGRGEERKCVFISTGGATAPALICVDQLPLAAKSMG